MTMPELETIDMNRVKRVICSVCKKEFKTGERFIMQSKGVFFQYELKMIRGERIELPSAEIDDWELLDHFHESCLR